MVKQAYSTPLDVVISSKRLGESLKIARKRRAMTQADVAMRIGAAREVVINAENGKSVTSYNLLALLWLYGLLSQAVNSVSDEKDIVGMSLEKSNLPERVRRKASDDF